MVITWKTRNIRSLFPLKDKNDYKSCVIYKGDCSCGSCYIGETKRNAEVRWNEHNNPTKSSEPSKHLPNNINHYFTWAVISNAPKDAKTRKNLEASYIALWKPSPNEQKDFERLVLFRKLSHRAIDDIMQTPKKEGHFFFFSVCYVLFLIALDN